MKTAYDIIIKPVLTEKSYQDMADKKFTFQVDVRANKTEIQLVLLGQKTAEEALKGLQATALELAAR